MPPVDSGSQAPLQEAEVRLRLADLGEAPQAHLQAAAALYATARQHLDPHQPSYSGALVAEVQTRQRLSLLAENVSAGDLRIAVQKLTKAQELLHSTPPKYGHALVEEADARYYLAQAGETPQAHLQQAVVLYTAARRYLDPLQHDYGGALANEGVARLKLAEKLGETPGAHLRQAVALFQAARVYFPPHDPNSRGLLMNEGGARRLLAELGETPREHLSAALALFQAACTGRELQSPDDGAVLYNEARTRAHLAELGMTPRRHLKRAAELYALARQCWLPSTPDHGYGRAYRNAQMDEGVVRLRLAGLGETPREQLQAAVVLFQAAREGWEAHHPTYSLALMNEAEARLRLAELGEAPTANRHKARQLCAQGVQIYEHESGLWGTQLRHQARILRQLGELETAYDRLKKGLTSAENVRAQLRNEMERIAYLDTITGQYAAMVEVCLDLANQDGQWAWEAWHWVHRCKNRTLLELLASARPRLTDTDGLLWEEYAQAAGTLDAQERELQRLRKPLHQQAGMPSPEACAELSRLEAACTQARQTYHAKRQVLLQRMDGTQVLQTVAVPSPQAVVQGMRTLADVDAQASHKPLLVEFFILSDVEVVVFLIPLWHEATVVIKRVPVAQGALRKMVEALRKAVETRQAQTWGQGVGDDQPAAAAQQPAAQKQAWRVLRKLGKLLQPWMHHVEAWQPTELVLSPHSLLNLLPLHAALWQGKPLIESYPVVSLPSPALATEIVTQRTPLDHTALLLGNPTGELGWAELEIQEIARLLKTQGLACELRVGEAVTTDDLRTVAPATTLLHFAGHARLNVDDFLESGLELADRRLRVLDITARVDLTQAALVYLSSCDSARAAPGRTDELMALTRAFLSAGTPTVLATLWGLNDEVAYTFARHFYRGWVQERMSLAVAYQQAMLQTRIVSDGHPLHWAPFVLIGAWR